MLTTSYSRSLQLGLESGNIAELSHLLRMFLSVPLSAGEHVLPRKHNWR